MLKFWWKHSSFRYYALNLRYNISFWLNAKKIYSNIEFTKESSSFRNKLYQKETRKRFIGYQYKNKIYLDNPGMSIPDRDVWESWKKKNLI